MQIGRISKHLLTFISKKILYSDILLDFYAFFSRFEICRIFSLLHSLQIVISTKNQSLVESPGFG